MGAESRLSHTPFRTKADIVHHLERRVLDREFVVGEKLPSERDLCLQYAVSRPVIREALAGLVERGLIDVFAGRGSFVRAVTTDDLAQSLTRVATRAGITSRDLVSARVMLECTAAEMAADRGHEQDIDDIFAALELHDAAHSLAERARTDLVFHEAVAVASGNPVIALMFGSIRVQVHALMLRSHSDRKVRRLGDPLHQQIAEGIRDRDPVAARAAMSEHLQLALNLFGKDLDRPLAEMLESRGLGSSPPLRTTELT